MAMAEFLKDLPTRNAENFTKINPDSCHRYRLITHCIYFQLHGNRVEVQ